MKRPLFLILIFSTLTGIIASCHKSDSNNDGTISFQNLAGTYKVTSLIVSQGTYSRNIYDSADVCVKDDLFEFYKDSSFKYVDAGLSCNQNGGFQSSWSPRRYHHGNIRPAIDRAAFPPAFAPCPGRHFNAILTASGNKI